MKSRCMMVLSVPAWSWSGCKIGHQTSVLLVPCAMLMMRMQCILLNNVLYAVG